METNGEGLMSFSVLVVDDLEMMRQAITEVLRKNGIRVAGEAYNGRAAVQMYSTLKPDVVLLDIMMPVMDGLEALRRLKSLDPDARIIMCSSMSGQKYVLRAIQLGARDFIVKPFQPQRIVSSVRKAAGKDG